MRYALVRWMQNFILTRWIWVVYQHDECGYTIMLPIWCNKPERYSRCNWKQAEKAYEERKE